MIMTIGNLSQLNMGDEETNLIVGVFGIVLTVWILFINSVLIISILMDDKRRRNVFCVHIVNLAIADLLLGVVVLPVAADYIMRGSWELGEDVCQFWAISDILLCTVSIIALVMINCDRFMFLTCPRMMRESTRYIVCCLMVMVPWIIGIALVLPLWILGEKQISVHVDDCLLVLREDYNISSLFVSFFVPGFLSFGINIAILLLLFMLRHRLDDLPVRRREDNPKRQIISVCIVSIVFILMWAPFFVVSLLMAVLTYTPPMPLLHFTIWMGYCNSAVTPILWMIFPSIREGVKSLLLCCCTSKKDQEDKGVEDTDEEDENKSMMDRDDDVFELKDTNET